VAVRPARSLLVDIGPLTQSPAFRRIFIARSVMLFGVGMVGVTVPVHVYALTGSTARVGYVASVEGLAFFAGFLFGGVLADRFDRWALIRASWLLSMVSFAGLATNAALLGAVWPIAVLVALNGLSGAIGITAMLAVLPSLVSRSKLHAVGALNTLSMRSGAVLAPVAGGAVVAVAGARWSYAAGAIAALCTTPLIRRARSGPPEPAAEPDAPVEPLEGPLRALWTGYRFIVRDRVVLGVMAAGVVGMLGGGSVVLIPAFVRARFGDEATVVGLMYSALSLGLVVGSVASGWVRTMARPGRLLLLMMILCFLCYAGAGASPTVLLVLSCLVAAGAVNSVEEVLRYALLQLHTPDELLGRVNSVFSAQNMSGIAVGALVAGGTGAWLGPTTAFWAYNLAMAAVSVLVLAALPTLRRSERAEPMPPAESKE
jgi:MFS transporter, ENTS family, enterobactin (siderophore) exporter